MKPTPRDLMVARAVRDRMGRRSTWPWDDDLPALIESLPEPVDELIAAMKPWPPEPAERKHVLRHDERLEPNYSTQRWCLVCHEWVTIITEFSTPCPGAPCLHGQPPPEPAEPEQAAQDADDEDWLDKLVRENGGEVELFTRAQVDAARTEGARAERERCFKIATDLVASWPGKAHVVSRQAGMMIAHAIRAAQDEHGGHEQAAQDSLTRLAIDVARAEGAREMKERLLRVLKNCVESERERSTNDCTGLLALEAAYELVAIRAARD